VLSRAELLANSIRQCTKSDFPPNHIVRNHNERFSTYPLTGIRTSDSVEEFSYGALGQGAYEIDDGTGRIWLASSCQSDILTSPFTHILPNSLLETRCRLGEDRQIIRT
jgi:hypothetical protein